MTIQQRAITVFCGSQGVPEEYYALARSLGTAIATSGARLIYGGGAFGLMGEVRTGVMEHGGHVTSVQPAFMHALGWGNAHADEAIITSSMHDRKAWMEEHADAFIVLPGGLGTLDELITVMTTRLLNQHAKPIILLDPTDYYGPLMALFAHMLAHNFIQPDLIAMPVRVTTPEAALAAIDAALPE